MSDSLRGPIILVGGGKMGAALAQGWLAAGLPATELQVVEPDAARRFQLSAELPCAIRAGIDQVEARPAPAALVLAVKPQMMAEVAPLYRPVLAPSTMVLSIAAGKTIDGLARLLGPEAAIVRAMPNTPAAVGRGVSVLVAGGNIGSVQRRLAHDLMAAVGSVEWVEDEELIHVVTALSGGGPAYVFLLIEALAAAGTACGLEPGMAMRLARGTVEGSGELAHSSSEPATQLRINVTSPGGTTAEALRVLMAPDALQPMVTRAIEAAARRSRELA